MCCHAVRARKGDGLSEGLLLLPCEREVLLIWDQAPAPMPVCLGAGLPPPPQLPLPPGLDSASAAPYQQKPIDLFKAIFEASDSDEDDGEEEEAEKKDTAMEDVVDAGDKGKPLGSVGSAAGAQNSVRAAEQGTNAAGTVKHCKCACRYCKLPSALLYSQGEACCQG